MICKKCGMENREGSSFCRECGTPLLAEEEIEYSREKTVSIWVYLGYQISGSSFVSGIRGNRQ